MKPETDKMCQPDSFSWSDIFWDLAGDSFIIDMCLFPMTFRIAFIPDRFSFYAGPYDIPLFVYEIACFVVALHYLDDSIQRKRPRGIWCSILLGGFAVYTLSWLASVFFDESMSLSEKRH